MKQLEAIPDHYARARPAITLGGPALYTDDGRRERVMVTSAAFDHMDEDGLTRAYRTVAFVDQDGALYDVQVKTLEPADDATWLIAGRKERHIMGAPPLGAYPSLRSAPVEEVRGDPLEGVEVRVLSDDQRRRLAEAEALFTEAAQLAEDAVKAGGRRGKAGEGQRLEGRRLMIELQAELATQADADSAALRLAELEALEKGRKGRVDVTAQMGVTTRVRVRTRSGLQHAFERGDLDGGQIRGEVLYEVAKRYRDAYERASGLTTPTGSGKGKTTEGRQLGVAMAIEDLRTMRLRMSRKQLAVVDKVCGQDETVRVTAAALKAGVPSVRRALRGGLALAAENKLWV